MTPWTQWYPWLQGQGLGKKHLEHQPGRSWSESKSLKEGLTLVLFHTLACATPNDNSPKNQYPNCSSLEAAAENQPNVCMGEIRGHCLWFQGTALPPEMGNGGAVSAGSGGAPGIHPGQAQSAGHPRSPVALFSSQVWSCQLLQDRLPHPPQRPHLPRHAPLLAYYPQEEKGFFKAALSPAFSCSFFYL